MKVKYALHKHTKMHNIIFRLGVALGWDFDDHDHDDDNMLWDGRDTEEMDAVDDYDADDDDCHCATSCCR